MRGIAADDSHPPVHHRASWPRILGRAAKAMLAHNMPMIAQALAYSTFLAIPSVGLLVIGLFTAVSPARARSIPS